MSHLKGSSGRTNKQMPAVTNCSMMPTTPKIRRFLVRRADDQRMKVRSPKHGLATPDPPGAEDESGGKRTKIRYNRLLSARVNVNPKKGPLGPLGPLSAVSEAVESAGLFAPGLTGFTVITRPSEYNFHGTLKSCLSKSPPGHHTKRRRR
jgi:hypothetical protein